MRTLFTCLLLASSFLLRSQGRSPFEKFGQVELKHLQTKSYPIDPSADAVILSDICDLSLEGNQKNWFSAITTRHTVVHILNKKGYSSGTVKFRLYHSGSMEEEVKKLKATTYNLVDGKLVATKMEKSGIFTEKMDAEHNQVSFTLPALKEGSIIEYEYTTSSDYIRNLDAWYFQNEQPTLWSELNFALPEFFTYSLEGRGFLPVEVGEKKQARIPFVVTDYRNATAGGKADFSAMVTNHRWVVKNAPALKMEEYISSLVNYRSGITLQQTSQSDPLPYRDMRYNWASIGEELSNADYFGKKFRISGSTLAETVGASFASQTSNLAKAQSIYNWTRTHLATVDPYGIYPNQNTQQLLKSGKGSRADINLFMVSLMKEAGLNAFPVIMSSRHFGRVNNSYPMITSFNMVIAALIDDKGYPVYMDAAAGNMPMGSLLPECYNGSARLVMTQAPEVVISPDSLKSESLTHVFLVAMDKGLEGQMTQVPGKVKEMYYRNTLPSDLHEVLNKSKMQSAGPDMSVKVKSIDSLEKLDEPMKIIFDVKSKVFEDDMIYFNPLLSEAIRKNPFSDTSRLYPIEMPYRSDDTYILTMDIPEGYQLEELPRSVKVMIDEDGTGLFEYIISASGNKISMRTRLKIDRTLFLPDEYESIREFYKIVSNKYNDQIVFRKKP